ncbi:MAG: tRNA lysidine(34) synthetase TilS [Ruminococcaceae bacterium]|nr:tRNA lysidine(34) synthetase TilS [Oscillospiraceae bacterium]
MNELFPSSLPAGFVSPATLTGLSETSPLLVAYSGGPDSTALLHMLCGYAHRHGAELYAAHVNHGIRGAEADRDEEFCRTVADGLGIRLFVLHAEVPKLAKESGESIETTARAVRYRFFDEIMQQHRIPLLATAHNAEDNLETMLFHLLRGSGLNGICGIPVTRTCEGGVLVRPILSLTREDILSYCKKYGLSYVTDSTNTDTDYTRNRLRAEVLPALRAIQPKAAQSAARLSRHLRSDALCLDSMATMFLEELRRGNALEIEKLNGSPDAIVHRALMSLYREISGGGALEDTHVLALCRLSEQAVPHSRLSLPHGIEAVIEDGWLAFRNAAEQWEPIPYSVPLTEEKTVISQTNCEIIIESSHKTKNIYKNSIRMSLDSATIEGNLFVRNRMAGDRIKMSGMHKSVKKLMCEKKIPLSLRTRLPVFCDDCGIVAVPCIGIRDSSVPHGNSSVLAVQIVFREKSE